MNYPRAGTLLIPSGPSHDPNQRHMFIVCTETAADGTNLLVPVASWVNDLCDATCRLAVHEHGFLRHPSYVFYRNARIEPAQKLHDGLAAGIFTTHDPVNGQVFLRVRNGICRSPQTARKINIYFGCP